MRAHTQRAQRARTHAHTYAHTHTALHFIPAASTRPAPLRIPAPHNPRRPDRALLELGESGQAAVAKYNLEEMQRAERKVSKEQRLHAGKARGVVEPRRTPTRLPTCPSTHPAYLRVSCAGARLSWPDLVAPLVQAAASGDPHRRGRVQQC